MVPDDAFLLTIQEHPDDDGPRLVYADWLEERGECDRAELIRLQCLGGGADRVEELIRSRGKDWAGPARHAYSFAFQRGFVEELTISAAALLERGEEIFAACPIRLLRLIGARPQLDRLVGCSLLGRVRALHLTGCQIGDEGAALLAACPYLERLTVLRVGSNSIGDSGAESIADSPWLEGLETLVLRGNLVGDAGAQALATTHPFGRLRTMDLSDNLIGDAGAEALARCNGFANLKRLDLSSQFKGWSAGLALRGRPYPIQPKQQDALARRFGAETCAF